MRNEMNDRPLTKDVIASRRRKIQSLMEATRARHKSEMTEIDDSLAALEQRCPHAGLNYDPDPSGGRCGCWSCRDCGYFGTRHPGTPASPSRRVGGPNP